MSVCEQRESWLLARQRGLGGSDMAAVVGMSPFKSAIDIFVGKVQAVEFGESIKEFLAWGNLLEPVIRGEYARRSGHYVVSGIDIAGHFPGRSARWGEQTIVRAATRGWQLGTPDGIMPAISRGLEIKNVGFRSEGWGTAGSDEVPDHIVIQSQWYIDTTGMPEWDVVPLFSGNTLETYRLYRNNDLISELVSAGESFWFDNVEKQVPPSIDESGSYARYLARKYSLATSDVLPANETINQWAAELRKAVEEKQKCESREQLAKNHLAELLAGHQKTKGEFGSINWVRPKEGSKVNWESVAKALNPPTELIAEHTHPVHNTPYIRPFWAKEK